MILWETTTRIVDMRRTGANPSPEERDIVLRFRLAAVGARDRWQPGSASASTGPDWPGAVCRPAIPAWPTRRALSARRRWGSRWRAPPPTAPDKCAGQTRPSGSGSTHAGCALCTPSGVRYFNWRTAHTIDTAMRREMQQKSELWM